MAEKKTENLSFAEQMKTKAEQRRNEAKAETLPLQKVVRAKSENSEQMNVRVSRELLARLDVAVARLAERGKRTRNAFVIEALEQWLERQEKG